MGQHDLAYAREHLEDLFARAARGEDVRIVDPKVGTMRLAPVAGDLSITRRPRKFGQWNHLAEISEARLLAPLDGEDLAWLSGDQSRIDP